ncbi:MAG: kinase [Candidatus Latescibacteria bacterium]|nr:kinase [Candidatus Latescibacterota bacterium]
MVISRTPFRISFFGGGTDYPVWYRQYGGSVLATTINKYCYLTCRYLPPFFEHKIRLVYSKIENCQTIDEIVHPAAREVLRYVNLGRGVEIHHDGDLPARSGMGSSSAFTVGLLHALYALQGRMASKHQLTMESIAIEQEILKETVGSQDQVLAAYGGFNHILFAPTGEIDVRPITITQDRLRDLNSHFMLFYTGIKRTASSVADSYIRDIENKKAQFETMKDLVEESLAVLNGGQDLTRFGELLHQAWQAKRSLSAIVSNPHVDDIYDAAIAAGAKGGKLTGAGGGGFLLLFVPPDLHDRVRERLNALVYVPFRFECSGSQIIFFDQEEDYSALERSRASQPIQAFHELTDESPSPPAPLGR